jgi:cytochrome c551/c552
MKKVIINTLGLLAAVALYSCSCGNPQVNQTQTEAQQPASANNTEQDTKGIGSIKEVKLDNPLDGKMMDGGKAVYDMKCSSCHKLDATKLVGPGWKDVTKRRKPEWIMNFVTNVDEMLNKDAASMAMLEECLVRMPNQNLTEQDARNVLEFMRRNDGEK